MSFGCPLPKTRLLAKLQYPPDNGPPNHPKLNDASSAYGFPKYGNTELARDSAGWPGPISRAGHADHPGHADRSEI